MDTVYLIFPDEQTARAVLADYIVDGEWITASHSHDFTVCGAINRCINGVIEQCAGWHVNWNFGELPAAAGLYVIYPITPSNVLAYGA